MLCTYIRHNVVVKLEAQALQSGSVVQELVLLCSTQTVIRKLRTVITRKSYSLRTHARTHTQIVLLAKLKLYST